MSKMDAPALPRACYPGTINDEHTPYAWRFIFEGQCILCGNGIGQVAEFQKQHFEKKPSDEEVNHTILLLIHKNHAPKCKGRTRVERRAIQRLH